MSIMRHAGSSSGIEVTNSFADVYVLVCNPRMRSARVNAIKTDGSSSMIAIQAEACMKKALGPSIGVVDLSPRPGFTLGLAISRRQLSRPFERDPPPFA